MDSITHTLVGCGLSRLLKNDQQRPLKMDLFLILASNLPDIDIIITPFAGGESFLWRRSITHSVFGLPILCLLFALITRLFFRQTPFPQLLGITLIAGVIHVLLDLLNSYGVVLFYPFSTKRYELSWVFIIDIVIWLLLIVGSIFSFIRIATKTRKRLWSLVFSLLIIYVSLSAFAHHQSSLLLANVEAKLLKQARFSYIFPEPFGIHRFRGVIRTNDTYYLYLVYPFSKEIIQKQLVQTDDQSPEIEKLRQTSFAKKLEWFFKAPVWEKIANSSPPDTSLPSAKIYDLRFRSLVWPVSARESFFTFYFDGQSFTRKD